MTRTSSPQPQKVRNASAGEQTIGSPATLNEVLSTAGESSGCRVFVAVYPANVQMAVDAVRSPGATPAFTAIALARLPLQIPLARWALWVAREG